MSNRPYAQHAWDVAGDYVVTLTAYNENHPEGMDASLTMHVQTTPTHFVMLGSTNPVAPYETLGDSGGGYPVGGGRRQCAGGGRDRRLMAFMTPAAGSWTGR